MHYLWLKKSPKIARRSDRACRCPFELQHEHYFVAHPTGSTQHGFDGGVDRLDDPEADRMIAVRRDALDMLEQEFAQTVPLGQPLPPQGVDPAVQEIQHAGPRLVRPEAVELLAQHVRFKQAPV